MPYHLRIDDDLLTEAHWISDLSKALDVIKRFGTIDFDPSYD